MPVRGAIQCRGYALPLLGDYLCKLSSLSEHDLCHCPSSANRVDLSTARGDCSLFKATVMVLACQCGAPFRFAGKTSLGLFITECLNNRHGTRLPGGFYPTLEGDHPSQPTVWDIAQFDPELVSILTNDEAAKA